jgi:hypothetical protein
LCSIRFPNRRSFDFFYPKLDHLPRSKNYAKYHIY